MMALPFIAMAMTAVAGTVSAISSYQGARAEASAARSNAELLEQRAQQSRDLAKAAAQRVANENRLRLGAQRAGFAASGVGVDTGSALLVQIESAKQGKLGELDALYRGELEGHGLESEAAMERWRGKMIGRKAGAGLFTGLLSTAGSTLSAYGGMKSLGSSSTTSYFPSNY